MGFTPDSPPVRSGDYTRFASAGGTTLPVGTGGIVALAFVDDTGPVNTIVEYTSFMDYVNKNGQPTDPTAPSEGYIAVYNAFKGEGAGGAGASLVLGYRLAS